MSTTGLKAMRNPMKPHLVRDKYPWGGMEWKCIYCGAFAFGRTPRDAYVACMAQIRNSAPNLDGFAAAFKQAVNRGMGG